MYEIKLLQSPSPDEIERMADILHEAFSRRYFFGALGEERLSRELLKVHISDALVAETGEIYVALAPESGDIVGVAVWFGPGTVFLGTKAQREAGWDQLYAAVTKERQDWWDYFLALYDNYTTKVFGEGVKLGGFHLQVIGVSPAHRRRGIARSFFEVVERKAAERGVCTCLETVGSGAVMVYQGLGYEVKEPEALRSSGNPDATAPLYGFIKQFVSQE